MEKYDGRSSGRFFGTAHGTRKTKEEALWQYIGVSGAVGK